MSFRNVLSVLLGLFCISPVWAAEKVLVLASTTSTENSGLYDFLLPIFREETGIAVRVVAVGTGQAMKLAQRGDADVLLVHHRSSEDRFIAEGYGIDRRDVMYNDFVIVGPGDDPAGILGVHDVGDALRKIAKHKAMFVSRGDDSGTHKMERDLWRAIDFDVRPASGDWYRETGSGMGATLNTAAAADAYTLTDRGTWLGFQNRRRLILAVQGDPRLLNPYGIIRVNPERFAHLNAEAARIFVDWLTSKRGQAAIAAFRINGKQLFFPNYKKNAP
ncbi:MAG: sulfate transporter [Rhodospirillaceae bacterium]|nr:MAG: sulfate transporter [Rhodospirillaceae bacterium]